MNRIENVHNYSNFILRNISLIIVFWIATSIGYVIASQMRGEVVVMNSTFYFSYLNDFLIAVFIGLLCFIPYLLLEKYKFNYGSRFIQTLFVIASIIQLALVSYNSLTLTPLGVDLFGYSISDIFSTVINAEDLSFQFIAPFFIVPLVMLTLNKLLRPLIDQYFTSYAFIAVVAIAASVRLIFPQTNDESAQNKIEFLVRDIVNTSIDNRKIRSHNVFTIDSYPFLRYNDESKDVLSPFLNLKATPPNIVFVVLEGFGSDFVGENAEYQGFTPFLDSLQNESLNWKNFVCNSGRSFGVLPSLLGSLPFGENGFLELTDVPAHLSIISLLKENNFHTAYFEGSNSNFDRKLNFLEYQGIETQIDQKHYGTEYERIAENSAGFSWGYADHEIYKKALSEMLPGKQPRLDIIITQTAHEPFIFPGEDKYALKVDEYLQKSNLSDNHKAIIKSNKKIFSSLLYADQSLEYFINQYKKKSEFENSIIIITGDHRLIPIPHKDVLSRFHVPFLIYGPLIKKPRQFHSVSSHLDVVPSLIALLQKKYQIKLPEKLAWLGSGIDTATQFRNIHRIPLIRYKGLVQDFISGDYFLHKTKLYSISEKFNVNFIKDNQKKQIIQEELDNFKGINAYVTLENRLYPDTLTFGERPKTKLSSEQKKLVESFTTGLNADQIFELAKEEAFEQNIEKAHLLCDYILMNQPDHIDARILKGRTFAWEQRYDEAELELLNALKRAPYYDDGYLAILDLYWWSDKEDQSPGIGKLASHNKLTNEAISFKLAKAYQRMGNVDVAFNIMDSLVIAHPDNPEIASFHRSLNIHDHAAQ